MFRNVSKQKGQTVS